MKPILKAILFLVTLTILDFLFRKGILAFLLPVKLPFSTIALILFTLFAALSLLITKWFANSEHTSLSDLGVSMSNKNRFDFLYGFIIGLVLWAVVSLLQSVMAGFSWQIRPEMNALNILYGFLFIFIADLGTELYTRAYPLAKFRDSLGANIAIIIMVFFVGLKSYSFAVDGELLFYTMLIPALHTIFFSIIYFKTNRLGGSLGVHTGANLVTISIFDLRPEQDGQPIPPGIFQPNADVETLSLAALQLPYVFMAIALSVAVYIWWKKGDNS